MSKQTIETVELVKIYKNLERKLRSQKRGITQTRCLLERIEFELRRRAVEARDLVGANAVSMEGGL